MADQGRQVNQNDVRSFSFEVQYHENVAVYKDDVHRMKGGEDNFLYIDAGLEACSFTFCYSTQSSPQEKAL